MARLSQVDLSHTGQKVLIYGPPKAGKTLMAGEAAQYFAEVIWLDLEHGFLTLKQLPLEWQERINIIQVPDNRNNQLAIRVMDELTKGKPVNICDLHGKVGVKCAQCLLGNTGKGEIQVIDIDKLGPEALVVMDSGTQLATSALALAMKDIKDIDAKPEWDHYMRQGLLVDRVYTMMQQSRANWIVISHDVDVEKSEKATRLVPQAGTRNFSKTSAKYFDHVVYVNIKNGKYNQNSDGLSDPRVISGSRTGVKLQTGVTKGVVDLLRTVRGTTENLIAKAALNDLAAPMAERVEAVEKPAKVVSAATQAILDRAKAAKEAAAKN